MSSAILDANVIYPAPLRDYLLHLANVELYHPKWTDEIQEEWIRNLLLNRKGLTNAQLEKTRNAMNSAFPQANVTGYKTLIEKLILPDENDRHVLAAAIHSKADIIITNNIKDFPVKIGKAYGIDINTPDQFISSLISIDKVKCIQALDNQVQTLRNPRKTKTEVLDTLENCGLIKSVQLLRA